MAKIVLERPFFMENEEWYYYDYEEGIYKLTDKASKEAKESYKKFYNDLQDEK